MKIILGSLLIFGAACLMARLLSGSGDEEDGASAEAVTAICQDGIADPDTGVKAADAGTSGKPGDP